ncbi:MAG: cytochrome c biogenesis heme-transporting ATPase CcmA [Pseudomonadota bacterium]
MYNSSNNLKVKNLTCARDDRVLFTELSLEVFSGELLLLEGRNGAGKTTLLRILSGLRQPDEGGVYWNDEKINDLGYEFYQDVSFMGHHNALKGDLTSRENLEVSIALSAGSEVKIEQALEDVKLAGYEDEFVRKFSAGMKRRLAIAKLLVLDTPLWVLDEPFTSVDVKGIKMIEGFIEQHLQKQGLVIMTSHHEVNIDSQFITQLRLK